MSKEILGYQNNNLNTLFYLIGNDPSLLGRLDNQLSIAKRIHPEKLCTKDVYSVLEIENNLGNLSAYVRNGLPKATPDHLEQFNVDEMRVLAKGIKLSNSHTSADLQLLFTLKQLSDDRSLSCLNLAQLSGTPYCLKGFAYNDENKRSSRSSEEFCPNSIAGCSEKILFYWRPYALGLQKFLFGKETDKKHDLKILDIQFYNKKNPPLITYQVDNGPIKEHSGALVLTDYVLNMKQTLFVQTCPCPTCSQEIIKNGVGAVVIQSLSKYKNGNGTIIDQDDVSSLQKLIQNGVEVLCPNASETVLRV